MGFEGGERPILSKHSKPKWQRAKALGAETKVLLVLVLMKEPFFVKGWLN